MIRKPARLWALLCLLLVLQLATAQSFQVVRRQDDAATTTAVESDRDDADKTSAKKTATETDAPESKTDSDRKASRTLAPVPSATMISTDGDLDNSTLKNSMPTLCPLASV